MKIADIVAQIKVVLPKHTNLLGAILDIDSIVVSGGNLATVTTITPHGLLTNNAVTLANVAWQNSINSVSRDGLTFTFTTTIPHDLTFNWQDEVELLGFTAAEWNDSFKVVAVPDRNTFKVQSVNGLPALNGNESLLEVRVDGVNGSFLPTITSTTAFTISGEFANGDYSGGTVSNNVRVSGVVDIERAVEEYTKQQVNDLWLFVVPKDADISKDRESHSDAISAQTTGTDLRVRLLDGFELYIVGSTVDDISGVDTLDLCRHDLLSPILKTLYGTRFTTGLSVSGDFKTILSGHGVNRYNRSFLVYQYDFQVVMDITADDAVADGDTRAFRDVDYIHSMGADDTTNATITDINLDGD